MLILGGAAMVLLFGAQEATRDVDAIFTSPAGRTIPGIASVIAKGMDLPPDWLNDAAKGYAHGTIGEGPLVFSALHVQVRSLPIVQLLAMKLSAWRDDVDIADSNLLLGRLSANKEQIWEIMARHLVPGRELKARYAFDDLWDRLHEPR